MTRNILYSIAGQALRAALQGGTFLVISKSLGPSGYGSIVPIISICFLANSFSSAGTMYLMLIHLSRDKLDAKAWINKAITSHILTSPLIFTITLGFCSLLFPDSVSIYTLTLLVLSDILFIPVIEITHRAFQALEKMLTVALVSNLHIALRFLIILALYTQWGEAIITVDFWAEIYLLTSMLAALMTLGILKSKLQHEIRLSHQTFSINGFRLSSAYFIQKGLADIDKIILSSLTTSTIVGHYAVAYRIMDITLIPMRGTLATLYNRIISNEKNTQPHQKATVIGLYFFSILSVFIVYILSDYITVYFGKQYEDAALILKWLSPYPILYLTRELFLAKLDAQFLIQEKAKALSFTLISNCILSAITIPTIGWKGSIISIYITEALLSGICFYKLRHNTHTTKPRVSPTNSRP